MKITNAFYHSGTWYTLPEGKTWPVTLMRTGITVMSNDVLWAEHLRKEKEYNQALTSALEHKIAFEDQEAITDIVFENHSAKDLLISLNDWKAKEGLCSIPEVEGKIVDAWHPDYISKSVKVFRLSPSKPEFISFDLRNLSPEQKPLLTLQEAKDKVAREHGQANFSRCRLAGTDLQIKVLEEAATLWNKSLSEEIESLRKENAELKENYKGMSGHCKNLTQINVSNIAEEEADRKLITALEKQNATYLEADKRLLESLRMILTDLQNDIDQPDVRYYHSDVKIIWNKLSNAITVHEEAALSTTDTNK